MKRYCREGKKCSIEAAIECGAIYALDCGMPCTWQLQQALCTSSINLFTVMHTLCLYIHVLYCALKEELHESICVEGGE